MTTGEARVPCPGVSAPDVSVVCSSYQRAHKLRSLFAGLETQTLPRDRFEVIVVNNGSTDDTAEVLESIVATSPLSVRVVTLDRNAGAGGGRNAGWRAANAPVVAFTDDDCVPEPTWLEAGLEAMAGPDASIVVGRTEPNPEQLHNTGAFSRTQRVTEASGTRYFNTCNIFYRRADLEACGGFDPRFRHKGGEDTDLGWRVLDSGAAAVFAPDAVVLHDVSVGSFRAALREAGTWLDIPLVTRRHPVRARPLLIHRLFWKKTHELVIIAVGGVALAAVLRNPLPLVAAIPWVRFRLRSWPIDKDRPVAYLPHAFLIDVVEVSAMVRGSIRNRALVL